jgi:cytochrome c556
MSTRMVRVVVGGLALVVVAGCASMGEKKMTAAEAIDTRQKLMKEQGKAWKNIQDNAKVGQIAAIVPDAQKLVTTSHEIPKLFPEGSLNPEKSAAKPEIWQRKDEFNAAAKNLEMLATKLRDTAQSGNAEQTQAMVKDFGRQACGTCHQPFRVPPKQQ